MAQRFLHLAFTPRVLDAQRRFYGRSQARPPGDHADRLGPDETAFITARDSFYLASVNADGWPYVQHRGGPPGFCRVLAPDLLAFADYKGNRQMLTTGNVAGDDRVCLFLMDYPARTRLKLLGHAEVLDARDHPELVRELTTPATAAQTERIVRVRVVAYDWNCPKYITPRYTSEEVNEAIAPLRARIAELENQLNSPRP